MTELAVMKSDETQKTQVDPETAERFIAEKRIGERIKRLRAGRRCLGWRSRALSSVALACPSPPLARFADDG